MAAFVLTAAVVVPAERMAGVCVNEPATRIDCYPAVANFPPPTEESCVAQGCCWKPLANGGIPCAFDAREKPDDAQCARVPPASRLECRNPRFATAALHTDKNTCHDAGCCFDDDKCFQPFFAGYELLTLEELDDGWRGVLVLKRFERGPFGNDVALLQLRVMRENKDCVRIRITDPAFPRFEVPGVVQAATTSATSHKTVRRDESAYAVHFTHSPFGVAVMHRATGDVLFNSTPPIERSDTAFNGLVFENQFLELSTQLEGGRRNDNHSRSDSDPVLFGLGERVAPLRLNADDRGDHYPMFARDQLGANDVPHTRDGGDNSAGVHPFYMQVRASGAAHGVFLLSSNAMEVVTQRRALTFRTTGGVLDVFVFAGPTPTDVLAQYTSVVGRPALPPYWALGYHAGLRGSTSLDASVALVAQMRAQGVPLDALWLDSAYMDRQQPFTLDAQRFPRTKLQQLADDLHFHSQYLVAVQLPTISAEVLASDDLDGGEDGKEQRADDNSGDVDSMDGKYYGRNGSVSSVDDDTGAIDRDDSRNRADGNDRDDGRDRDDGNAADSNSRDVDARIALQLQRRSIASAVSASAVTLANETLERGEAMRVFVRDVAGETTAQKIVGARWSAIVDFFHPNASAFWTEQLAALHDRLLPFDGLWLDLDEPSSACDVAFASDANACSSHMLAAADALTQRRATYNHEDAREVVYESIGAADVASLQASAQAVTELQAPNSGGFVRSSDVAFPFDPYRQPFAPGQNTQERGGHGNLNSRTLPMAALHFTGLHYNVHSLFGHAAARTTREALDRIRRKRSLLLARSTFAGTGRFAGHWFEATSATWQTLQLSIARVLQMNLLGIPLTGPNICGGDGMSASAHSSDEATTELCVRWHQAASFFPLLRHHAQIAPTATATAMVTATHAAGRDATNDVDPAAVNLVRDTLLRRYAFLPHLYTQLFIAHTTGAPVLRPLVVEFPADRVAAQVEYQYLVGAALMVSPVVHEGAIAKSVYFPDAVWYDATTGKQLIGASGSDSANSDGSADTDDAGDIEKLAAQRTIKLLTPLRVLQLHLRGGFVVPTQQPASTTTLSRRGAFTLLVALDTTHEQPRATGELFVDDGDSLDSVAGKRYSRIEFRVHQHARNQLDVAAVVAMRGYDGPEMHVPLRAIKVFGLAQAFHANSSLRAVASFSDDSDGRRGDGRSRDGRSRDGHSRSRDGGSNRVDSKRDVHAEYFANAQTLVLSDLDVSVGQAFHVRVIARPGATAPAHVPSATKDADSDADEADEAEQSDDGADAAKQHGRASHGSDGGAAQRNDNDVTSSTKHPQHKHKHKQRYSVLAIIGAVVGGLFLLGIVVLCVLQRRRNNGYSPIA